MQLTHIHTLIDFDTATILVLLFQNVIKFQHRFDSPQANGTGYVVYRLCIQSFLLVAKRHKT